jgi:hypothetical protein
MTSASDKPFGFKLQPNVLVEVVNTAIRILEVPGSNLRPETGITMEGFRRFSRFLQPDARIIPHLDHGLLLPYSFQLIIRLSCLSCNGIHPVVRTNDSVRQNCITV